MRIFFSLAFLFFFSPTYAQQASPDSTPAIIRHLLSTPKEVPYIYTKLKNFIPDNQLPFLLRNERQYLVKTTRHLYAGVEGTGFLFQVKDSAGLLRFQRIDKTHNYGHTYFAHHFTINDTIYSLGGYGFWKSNGQLRSFNPTSGEWNLLKLNQEIHIVNTPGWLDQQNGLIYCYGAYMVNQGFTNEEHDRSSDSLSRLFVLDIRQRKWSLVGVMLRPLDKPAAELNTQSIEFYKDGAFNACPFGYLLFMSFDHVFIDDFLHNKRLLPQNGLNIKISRFFNYTSQISYYTDSTLFFGNITLKAADSIRFSATDFEVTNEPVFKNIPPSRKTSYWFLKNAGSLLAGSILGFLVVFLIGRFKKTGASKGTGASQYTQQPEAETGTAIPATDSALKVFDEVETELIRFIIDKGKTNASASVTDMNRILGLAGKNEPVQKKNRSERISGINEKWMLATGKTTPLIFRKRSEFDKRSIEYYSNPEDWDEAGIFCDCK